MDLALYRAGDTFLPGLFLNGQTSELNDRKIAETPGANSIFFLPSYSSIVHGRREWPPLHETTGKGKHLFLCVRRALLHL
jgi:hypothetical protein